MIRSAPTNWNPRCKQLSLAERQTLKQWHQIRDRCVNVKCRDWKNYGAKGIRLHGNWYSFPTFLLEVGARPSVFHTLQRLDRDLGYVPGNVQWMTKLETTVLRQTPAQQSSLTRDRFTRRTTGSFDWDAWRAAGSPEF
jgi:hypothetical protein